MILQQFDREEFVRIYWQKQPFLIKHQGPDFQDPLSPEELAGLSCEDDVESRLVTTTKTGVLNLDHGPFDEALFTKLPDNNWALLVQAVDQYLADVEQLKTKFDFIPRWRIDDIMVSFACDGGGVGPHYDQYDVFLLQGKGSRKWRIGGFCDNQTPLRSDTELRVMENFQAEREFILEPGDILYLPPRLAHYGVSLGDSLCYSVGFRAPSLAELIQGFTDQLVDSLSEDRRYSDSTANIQPNPDELTATAIDAGFKAFRETIDDKTAFIDWFGRYVTTPRYPEKITAPETQVDAILLTKLIKNTSQLTVIYKNSSSRYSYFTTSDSIKLFVDGRCFIAPLSHSDTIKALCALSWAEELPAIEYVNDQDTATILASLINQGSLLACPAD